MAPRKVIADSEDEDEEEDAPVPYSEDACVRPEPELLSPHHRPSSPAALDSNKLLPDITDASFFTDIYTDQRSLTAQQSFLIENIVRQSQKASGSSGNVSLPPIKMGRKANPSSGTDVTSPWALSRPRNNRALISDGASEFTTPLKSTSQVWDIPSSAGDARNQRDTYGKSKGSVQKASLEESDGDYQPCEDPRTSPAPMPAAKRAKLSHHDSVPPSTATFYIAQSNLTTMQKLEYQKVHVPTNGYSGLPGSLSNPKPTSSATIPYSTPSGYSQYTRRRDESPVAASPEETNVINISSSPDVIEMPASHENRESRGRRQNRALVGKEKEAVTNEVEEDELCQDNTWDPDDIGLPRELYKPRPTKRRAAAAVGLSDVKSGTDTLEEVADGTEIQTLGVSMHPASSLMDTDPLERSTEAPPKKRGCKKKREINEAIPTEAGEPEVSYVERNADPPSNETEEDEAVVERPRKQRGRSRKTETPKGIQKELRESPVAEEPQIHPSQQDDGLDVSTTAVKRGEDGGRKANRKKNKTTEETEAVEKDKEFDDNRLPLKEVDRNPKALSEPVSTRETPSKAADPNDEKSVTGTQPKETTRLAATQAKATYRVGLSKRSRIAPLLKTIRK